jgi:hypothetical protein
MMAALQAGPEALAPDQSWRLQSFAWRKRLGVGAFGGFRAAYSVIALQLYQLGKFVSAMYLRLRGEKLFISGRIASGPLKADQ